MAVLRTGRSKLQSPFAAGQRAIERRMRAEQDAAIEQGRQERAAYDERLRQRVAEGRRNEEIRRKAGLAEEDRKMRRDLIQTLARGKGQGMFGAKVPRINKFILHAPEMEKDPKTGKLVKASEITGETRIDPGHIERLRTMAAATRDEQAVNALALQGKGRLPKRTENALSDLASDDFPAFSRLAEQAAGAIPDEPMPDPITGGGYVPPEIGIGGPGPTGDVQAPGPAPAVGGDIDLTQLLSQGIIGPQSQDPQQFQPGFAQGFQGVDEPAAPIENIHELISSGLIPGTKGQAQRGKQQDLESAQAALGRPFTEQETLRFFGAEEKKIDPKTQAMLEMMKLIVPGVKTGAEPTKPAPKAAPKPTAPAAPAAPAPAAAAPTVREEDLASVRQQFLAANPGRTVTNIALKDGIVRITDDTGKIWRARIRG